MVNFDREKKAKFNRACVFAFVVRANSRHSATKIMHVESVQKRRLSNVTRCSKLLAELVESSLAVRYAHNPAAIIVENGDFSFFFFQTHSKLMIQIIFTTSFGSFL